MIADQKKRRGAAGFTLVELIVAIGLLVMISVLLVGLSGAQLRLAQSARERASRAAELDKAVAVVESWMNWANSTALLPARNSSISSDTGSVLRLDFSERGQAWLTLSSSGLSLECPDGTVVLLSTRLRPPVSGQVFQRTVPSSPWEDGVQGTSTAYSDPFSRTGVVVLNYSLVGEPLTRQRGFVMLGQ